MQSLQIAASEIWVTLIFCVIMYLFRRELKKKWITRTLILVCIARLLSDAVSWGFDGLPGPFWGFLTRTTNYLTFVSNDLISLVFSLFLWELIGEKGERPSLVLEAYWVLEGIAVGALTLNLHFGWFYSFDSDNLYSRGPYYALTHVAPVAALVVLLWMLLRYHKRFSRNLKILAWSYLIPMAVATAYELMQFGLSLQAYAQAFSALVAFFVAEIEIRQDLERTKQQLENTNADLQAEEQKLAEALTTQQEMDAELRKQQEELSQALAAAQQANEAKTTFLNSMSHDIRTPMNAIIGFTSLAAGHADNPEMVREYLKKISISSEHLLDLINDVLDMSRIESGKTKLVEKPVHLPEIIHGLRTIIQPSAAARQLDFRLDAVDVVDEDVITDKLRLTQILLNILSNGVKYNKTGGLLALCIRQEKTAPAGYAAYHFLVRDTGIGMSEEFQKHVFESFAREETATVSGIQGTGLGMAITKKSVELLGGTITVASSEGVGSTFDVALTFKLDDTKPRTPETGALQGLRVLVAGGENDSSRHLLRMLTAAGMCPVRTAPGQAAVTQAQQAAESGGAFDAYLLDGDWNRTWDGNREIAAEKVLETVRRLRKLAGAEKPILLLTAHDWTDLEEKAKQAGVTAFCEKPLFLSELRALLTQPMPTAEQHALRAEDCRGRKILLVEDNALNQEIAAAILEGAGFVLDMVDDGREAVEKMAAAKPGQYDLILMDIQMPLMNGYEATKRIRAMESPYCRQVPIIAMTANAFEEDKALALQAGMNDYLAKPVHVDELMKVLARVLNR